MATSFKVQQLLPLIIRCNEFRKQAIGRRWLSIVRGPSDTLKAKIANGELHADEYQQRVVKELEVVYDDISRYAPSSGVFSFIFKEKIPKGLYIFGSVGGGKTMLMDLFYECCQVTNLFM